MTAVPVSLVFVALLAGRSVASTAEPPAAPALGVCAFAIPLGAPSYWEPECTLTTPGCWADSANVECRFCGQPPYGDIPCPAAGAAVAPRAALLAGLVSEAASSTGAATAAAAPAAQAAKAAAAPKKVLRSKAVVVAAVHHCSFDNPPATPYYWEPSCRMGIFGCNADDTNVQCRFCGSGAYSNIPCRPTACSFPNEPRTPYYWDETCAMNVVGCNADGIHVQCRFCVNRPFDPVRCPSSLTVAPGRCTFQGLPPTTPYFWDPTCEFGTRGCWADGLHAECRWCSAGAYKDIPCSR